MFHPMLSSFCFVFNHFLRARRPKRRVRRLGDSSGYRRKSLRLTAQRQNQWIIQCAYDRSDSERIESHLSVRWRRRRSVLNGSGFIEPRRICRAFDTVLCDDCVNKAIRLVKRPQSSGKEIRPPRFDVWIHERQSDPRCVDSLE